MEQKEKIINVYLYTNKFNINNSGSKYWDLISFLNGCRDAQFLNWGLNELHSFAAR